MDTEEFAAPDTQAPAATPQYHTTNQLQALVATATGKPCKSRNRPALLKKLGMAAEGKPAAKKVNGKRPGKPKPSRAPTPRQQAKAAAKAGVAAAKAKRASASVDLRAAALKAVTAAMARKNPPSLRALCAELAERKIQRPRGGLDWLPSSVQSLMKQPAGKARTGAAGRSK